MDFAALLRQAREEAAKGQTRGNKDRAAACAPALASLRNAEEGRLLGCRVVELLPGTCWYCADFVSAEEADALEVEVRKQPWEQLSGRKLQNWGGVPHPSGTILEPMPTFVDALATRLHASGVFADEKPNQALVNLYSADEGIAPHQDGPTFKPRAAILSLSQRPAVLAFRDPKETSAAKALARIVMEPRSLVVFAGQAYLEWEHWVPAAQEQSIEGALNASLLSVAGAQDGVTIKKSERISLTMRCVANVKTSVDEDDLALDPEMRREVARRHEWWRRAISQ